MVKTHSVVVSFNRPEPPMAVFDQRMNDALDAFALAFPELCVSKLHSLRHFSDPDRRLFFGPKSVDSAKLSEAKHQTAKKDVVFLNGINVDAKLLQLTNHDEALIIASLSQPILLLKRFPTFFK